MFLITFLKNLFKKKNKCIKNAKEVKVPKINNDENPYKNKSEAEIMLAKTMRNTAVDDERIINKITIRRLKTHEDEYLKKK